MSYFAFWRVMSIRTADHTRTSSSRRRAFIGWDNEIEKMWNEQFEA